MRSALIAIAALVILSVCSKGWADTLTINNFNNDHDDMVFISADDGAGDTINGGQFFLTQFNVTYTNAIELANHAIGQTFNTFCNDLFHSLLLGQTYAVNFRTDLATAVPHGSEMEYIYQNFGQTNLTGNDDQAAAVQLALWDLSLPNHNPTTFSETSLNTYSSGDSDFLVDFNSVADATTIAGLVNTYLQAAQGATLQGDWLDASAAGDAPNRGQSMLVPVPEPTSLALVLGIGALALRRRR